MNTPLQKLMNCFDHIALRSSLVALAAAFLSGCVTATVQEVRERATGINASDAVVVLGRRSHPSNDETEIDFINCVAENLDNKVITVFTEAEFVDATFPWFEPRTAPVSANELPALLEEPLLAKQLEQLGLRYVVWIQGQTKRVSQAGSMTCGVSPGGGGCFGFLTWENDASYEASIWDTQEQRTAGRISSDAAGTSYMPALVVPIPIIARVQQNACTSLSNQLEGFILN